jgi:hypothetical protein
VQTNPLGKTTEFASPLDGSDTGKKPMSKTVQRYYLQSLARELLARDHRIHVCMHCLSPVASAVDIMKVSESNRAYFSGLMVCGLVWICPVCAARITEERRQELTSALSNGKFSPMLATYTLRHKMNDPLSSMLNRMLEAYRKMKSGKAWQWLKEEYGWKGSIKSLEVTHGNNGWHPHQHELILLDQSLSKSARNGLKIDLKAKWGASLARCGLDASWEHGVDLRTASSDIEEYVAKFGYEPIVTGWTIEHELTKQPSKKSKKDGKTPLQLLSDYGEADLRAGRLWKEYAKAFHGKKQLVWSKGLRDELGMGDELDDKAIAESVPSEAFVLARLTPVEWKAIRKADLRGELLDAASTMTDINFRRWLNEKLEKWL